MVGDAVGDAVGDTDGAEVGLVVGVAVGTAVGLNVVTVVVTVVVAVVVGVVKAQLSKVPSCKKASITSLKRATVDVHVVPGKLMTFSFTSSDKQFNATVAP